MKVQPVVKTETQKMALGVGILTVLMIAVFLIARQFDITVLLGALLGSGAAIGNFFLMALTVQKITDDMPHLPPKEEKEEKEEDGEESKVREEPLSEEAMQGGKRMRLSYTLRMLVMLGVAALGVWLPQFHPVSTLIPMLFPRIVIALRGIFENKQKEA